jgi:hypothetical protein
MIEIMTGVYKKKNVKINIWHAPDDILGIIQTYIYWDRYAWKLLRSTMSYRSHRFTPNAKNEYYMYLHTSITAITVKPVKDAVTYNHFPPNQCSN